MAPAFGVLLKDYGPNRLAVMSHLRKKLGLSLKEAKAITDSGSIELASGETLMTAERLAAEFQGLGAEVEVFISGTGHEDEI